MHETKKKWHKKYIKKDAQTQSYWPEAIEHSPIRMQTNHAVLHCDPMDKRFLVIYKVSIRHPELISHSVIQSKIERNPCVGQALIAPRLLEIHGDGIVLKNTQKNCSFHKFQRIGHFTLMPDFHCVRYNIEKQVAFTAKKDSTSTVRIKHIWFQMIKC